ncbi:glycerol-3-phosphate dehydrogenase [Benzoatithermus flavus]|uniref:glycerol-3-phosphate dehydrogenase n=1 Tax=Benzoatithermus flavus TaxID=3108223 RepID=UPI003AAB1800
MSEQVDMLVVGGGINGAGIARDAAGRGLKVLLVEQDDLASHTSRWSSKLIHGGLRYLEYYEFRLVREALIEREVLLRAAPHIVRPLTFVLPHVPEMRPAWLIRLGLFLYDHLGGREILPGSKAVDLAAPGPYGAPLKPWVKRGFTYSDCWVEDSRLVVLNAMDAAERGAEILTRTRCERARRKDGTWTAELVDAAGRRRQVRARALVNAAGPWVQRFLEGGLGMRSKKRVRLVKGSHIVVPKLYDGDHPYILQNDDRRIVFAIPFEGRFTLIGTTDVPYEGDPAAVAISPEETDYLCRVVNRYFRREIEPRDVVWAYAGVRPLYDDASGNVSAVTRDYVFDVEGGDGRAPLLSIFGGKITTYRKLAEHALDKLRPHLGFGKGPWTATAPLPGGDMPGANLAAFTAQMLRAHAFVPEPLLCRWVRTYGTRLERLIGGARRLEDLGADLGGGLLEAEVDYLVAHEWARTADDILWRRTRLGLHVGEDTVARLQAKLEERPVPAQAAGRP